MISFGSCNCVKIIKTFNFKKYPSPSPVPLLSIQCIAVSKCYYGGGGCCFSGESRWGGGIFLQNVGCTGVDLRGVTTPVFYHNIICGLRDLILHAGHICNTGVAGQVFSGPNLH